MIDNPDSELTANKEAQSVNLQLHIHFFLDLKWEYLIQYSRNLLFINPKCEVHFSLRTTERYANAKKNLVRKSQIHVTLFMFNESPESG